MGTLEGFVCVAPQEWLKCHRKVMRLKRRSSPLGTRRTDVECVARPEEEADMELHVGLAQDWAEGCSKHRSNWGSDAYWEMRSQYWQESHKHCGGKTRVDLDLGLGLMVESKQGKRQSWDKGRDVNMTETRLPLDIWKSNAAALITDSGDCKARRVTWCSERGGGE